MLAESDSELRAILQKQSQNWMEILWAGETNEAEQDEPKKLQVSPTIWKRWLEHDANDTKVMGSMPI